MRNGRLVKDFTSVAIENVQRAVALSSNTTGVVDLGTSEGRIVTDRLVRPVGRFIQTREDALKKP